MDMNVFLTQQAQQQAMQQGTKTTGTAGNGSNALTGAGLNFLDLFLAQGDVDLGGQTLSTENGGNLLEGDGEGPDYMLRFQDLAGNILSSGQGDLEALATEQSEGAEGPLSIAELLGLRAKAEGNSSKDALKNLLQHIENIEGTDNQNLIATNLDPAQITQIKTTIEDILSGKEGNLEELPYGALFVGQFELRPAQKGQELRIVPRGMGLTNQNAALAAANNNQGTELTGKLHFQNLPESFNTDGVFELEEFTKGSKGNNFEHILKQLAGKNILPANQAQGAAPDSSVIQGWPFSVSGSLFSIPSVTEQLWSELGLLPGGNIPANGSLSGTMGGLTSLLNHAPHAAQPHPGTQMVAAHISKNAADGTNRNITLQLDPPELGRVEVRMAFGKDKSLKAIVMAEKPETYMMLQRDAQVLERALQDAGLDGEGSELSFELAQDDHEFSHNGNHDGEGPQGQARDGEEEELIVETTMSWSVDPVTGYPHYVIWA